MRIRQRRSIFLIDGLCYCGVREAARRLGVTPNAVMKRIHTTGTLPHAYLNNKPYVPEWACRNAQKIPGFRVVGKARNGKERKIEVFDSSSLYLALSVLGEGTFTYIEKKPPKWKKSKRVPKAFKRDFLEVMAKPYPDGRWMVEASYCEYDFPLFSGIMTDEELCKFEVEFSQKRDKGKPLWSGNNLWHSRFHNHAGKLSGPVEWP